MTHNGQAMTNDKTIARTKQVISSLTLCFSLILPMTSTANTKIDEHIKSKNETKNIIYLVGDGMGPAAVSAYRYNKNQIVDPQQQAPSINKTLFDDLWVGTATTYPRDKTWVTDSAAAATALSTGIKTYNGAIAVDHKGQALKTLFEYAKENAMATGIAVTSPITHATPASFYAHQISRKQSHQIADWLVDNKTTNGPIVDLILGAGRKDLKRKDRNLIKELKHLGYQYSSKLDEIDQLTHLPAMGLFHKKEFPYALDSDRTRLATMTKHALKLLNKHDKGFVLLVEGSLIDWCGHDNDIACLLAEMEDFENALKVAHDFAKNNDNTLVIATADHETGGLSLGQNGDYQWFSHYFSGIKNTAQQLTKIAYKQNLNKHSLYNLWHDKTNIKINEQELALLYKSYKKGEEQLISQIKQFINTYTNTGWTSGGHTGVDVPVLAFGSNKALFSGVQDNTDIAKKLIKLVSKQDNQHE